ncbi:hypothetical protein ANCDUO_18338, partial [Ancylostoma duodenale]
SGPGRRLLATGWAEDKQIKYAKPALAMPKLSYDCDVEDEIMTKLKDCPGSVVATTKAQKSNFKLYTPYTATRQKALSEVIKQWWSPLADTGIADNKYLDNMADTPMEAYVNVRHRILTALVIILKIMSEKDASQMAYDHTTGVGCAVKDCDSKGNIQVQCGYVMN